VVFAGAAIYIKGSFINGPISILEEQHSHNMAGENINIKSLTEHSYVDRMNSLATIL
jgi:hypothetical protein